MRQLVAIRLSVHRVREALAMRSLVHGLSSAAARDRVQTADASDTSDAALLDASSLAAHHGHASVGNIASKADAGATWSLVGRRVVDPINRIGSMVAVQVAMLHDQG